MKVYRSRAEAQEVVAQWVKSGRPVTRQEWDDMPWWKRAFSWLAWFALISRVR